MSGNSILTDSIITQECLFSLKNHLAFTKNMNRDYDKNFAKDGAKVGDTANVRKPPRYEVTQGAALRIQDSVDQSIPVKMDTQLHVGLAFSVKDRTLSIDRFRERYIDPAMIALANQVDFMAYQKMYRKVFSAVGVPSATALPSTLKGFTQAKQKLAELGAPKGKYTALVSPGTEASLVEGLKGLFQSSEEIAKQYEEGTMGFAAGSKFMMSQNVVQHTIGALGGTPLVNGAPVSGAVSIVTDGWTASTQVLNNGDVISFAGVYAVNPQTRQSTGSLAQFAVQADVTSDGSGVATITLDRAIVSSGQYQNVTALPADNAAITIFGHASSYAGIMCPQNLVYHKNAFTLVSADLALPEGGAKGTRMQDEDSGLSLMLTEQFDIQNHRNIKRVDILFGVECIYAELAARVVGQPA